MLRVACPPAPRARPCGGRAPFPLPSRLQHLIPSRPGAPAPGARTITPLLATSWAARPTPLPSPRPGGPAPTPPARPAPPLQPPPATHSGARARGSAHSEGGRGGLHCARVWQFSTLRKPANNTQAEVRRPSPHTISCRPVNRTLPTPRARTPARRCGVGIGAICAAPPVGSVRPGEAADGASAVAREVTPRPSRRVPVATCMQSGRSRFVVAPRERLTARWSDPPRRSTRRHWNASRCHRPPAAPRTAVPPATVTLRCSPSAFRRCVAGAGLQEGHTGARGQRWGEGRRGGRAGGSRTEGEAPRGRRRRVAPPATSGGGRRGGGGLPQSISRAEAHRHTPDRQPVRHWTGAQHALQLPPPSACRSCVAGVALRGTCHARM